jgi:hypothetical protein
MSDSTIVPRKKFEISPSVFESSSDDDELAISREENMRLIRRIRTMEQGMLNVITQ